jgi:hypothetical protein
MAVSYLKSVESIPATWKAIEALSASIANPGLARAG